MAKSTVISSPKRKEKYKAQFERTRINKQKRIAKSESKKRV